METIKYIETGVNWLGKIPSTWESKRIKMLTRVKRGASPRPIDNPIYFDEEGEFAWVRIADVTASERYLKNTTQRLSELGSSLSVKRYPDDFFLSIAGTVGKPIITKIKCCIHDGFVYFPDLKINPEFLYYIFSTGLPYLGLGKLGTQLNLNTDTVGDIYIPIPEEKEIEKIVSYLDERTAEIDSLISKKQKLIECLKEEKMSIINQAVTKGINPNAAMKDSGIEWLGNIPEHWEIKKLKYIGQSIIGITYNPNEVSSQEEGILVLRASNVQDGVLSFDDNVFVNKEIQEKQITKEGDILICARNGSAHLIGKCAYIPKEYEGVTFGAFMLIYRSNIGKYMYYVFNSELFKSQSGLFKTSTINQLTAETINNMYVPITYNIDEQEEIVEFLNKETKKIDDVIFKVSQEIDLIKEYRTSLINEVVTGKIILN